MISFSQLPTLCPASRTLAALAGSFGVSALLLSLDTTALASETARTFAVDQPPVGLSITLTRAGKLERMRIDLPLITESIQILDTHEVRLSAQSVSATLNTASDEVPVLVTLAEATAGATPNGRVVLVRSMQLVRDGTTLATFEVRSEMILLGLTDTPPHVTVRSAQAKVVGAVGGMLAGAEIGRIGPIATPVFPLEMVGASRPLVASRK